MKTRDKPALDPDQTFADRQAARQKVAASKQRSYAPFLFGGIVVAVFAGMYVYLSDLLASDAKPVKQVVEVQVFRPPPPPPPKVEPEPPPPEMEEEEVDIPEPEALEDIPDLPDAPPAEMLGLDADGVAGSDAFGLAANRGGRGIIGGAGAHRWYAQKMKDQVSDYLSQYDDVKGENYKVRILLWVHEDGEVARARLAESSGDPAFDAFLMQRLMGMDRFSEKPPPDMPQPVAIRVVGHA